MITTKYVRDNIDAIRESLDKRKSDYPIGELLGLDKEVRKLKTELQELQAKRNKASLDISEMKKKGLETEGEIAALKNTKDRIEGIGGELLSYEEKVEELLSYLPNVIEKDVPYGIGENQSPEIKKQGTIRRANLAKTHEELLLDYDFIDLERAAKVSGARFFYLKRDLVLLEHSLLRFTLDMFVKKDFIPISPPFMIRKNYYKGVVPLDAFEEALYAAADPKEVFRKELYERTEDELFLISTTEHPLVAMHADETFAGNKLPIRYIGISPAFRREAGAHGKDTKGIFRVHQFMQTEQVIFSRAEDSAMHLKELLKNIEDIWQKLDVPYRVIEICSGELSAKDAKSFDLETYLPSQQSYREIASCSNCTDWQSIRLNIKYDEKGERKHVHTLNGTGVPSPRVLISIIENYLNDDGSITVPDALVPYMGKDRIGR